jgi:hypothetical protein
MHTHGISYRYMHRKTHPCVTWCVPTLRVLLVLFAFPTEICFGCFRNRWWDIVNLWRRWLSRHYNIYIFLVSWGGVRLESLGTSATNWPMYQPWMIDDDDDDECGAVRGMRIGRGNRSTRKKPAPVPLCPPQIPHDLGSNPGRRGGKPTTNRLSYGMALSLECYSLLLSAYFRYSYAGGKLKHSYVGHRTFSRKVAYTRYGVC